MDPMKASVADLSDCRTESARNRLRRPGAEGCLPDAIETENLQVGIPEPTFLLRKPRRNRVERGLARWQHAIISWANQVDALFDPARRGSGRSRACRNQSGDQNIAKRMGQKRAST